MKLLRLAVLLLLLANGMYFAWSHHLLGAWGPAPVTEPHRLEQQIRPEQLQLVPRRAASATPAADAGGLLQVANLAPQGQVECLIAGVFDEGQGAALRQALATRLPPASWGLEPVVVTPARWIVYMGRYPGEEGVERKKAELRALGVRFDAPANPALVPGLALGRFDSEPSATQELANLTRRGVHTARVVMERAEVRGLQVRLPAVDDRVRAGLADAKLALAGKPLRPCTV